MSAQAVSPSPAPTPSVVAVRAAESIDPPSLRAALIALVQRDLRLAGRRRSEATLPIVFFIVAVGLFPLGVGPEPQVLRQIAPGVVWVCALLAAMLSINTLYAADHADGTLEQMLLCGQPLLAIAAARSLSHWLLTGLPLVLVAPLFGLMFDLSSDGIAALWLGLLLGTPVLSLRSGGMLVFLLVLPLAVPVLIFGAGAVVAVEVGLSPRPHFALLGALLLGSALLAPLASAAALRISTE
jgi:heme exporter protein B